MSQNENGSHEEIECYTKIINLFLKMSKDPIKLETSKNIAIIKIMDRLKEPGNEDLIRNALIILLSLFDDNPADLYSNLGDNVKKISKKEKGDIFSQLKEEFILKQRKKKYNELLKKIKDEKGDS